MNICFKWAGEESTPTNKNAGLEHFSLNVLLTSGFMVVLIVLDTRMFKGVFTNFIHLIKVY